VLEELRESRDQIEQAGNWHGRMHSGTRALEAQLRATPPTHG
jgi:hypothetical protein